MALVGSRGVRDNRASPLGRTSERAVVLDDDDDEDDDDDDESDAAFGKENRASVGPKCTHLPPNATFSIYEHGSTHH